MPHSFDSELARIWHKAVDLYRNGNTQAQTFPIEDETKILAAWGMNKIDVFDYAEDWCIHGEPDLISFVMIHYERWNFFKEEQRGILSSKRLDPTTLPEKSSEAGGIVWLPRIIPKARAKLRGELPPEVMYGCGGDRHFFFSNNIHPAEFLRAVRHFENNDHAIIQWVLEHRKASPAI